MKQETDASPFNFQELLSRCLGNIEFAERLLTKFESRFDVDLEELEKAIDAEDVEAVASIAHRLKGASATAAADGIRQEAAEIEGLARSRHVGEIPTHLSDLRMECSRFSKSLSSFARPVSVG
jgi:HPt (histidine-containing phosphotransfer) domain-containing protein